jgi:hypothetical protein
MAVKKSKGLGKRVPPKKRTPPKDDDLDEDDDLDLDEDDLSEEDEDQEEETPKTAAREADEIIYPDEEEEDLQNVLVKAEALCASGAIAVSGGGFGKVQANLRAHLNHELDIQSEIAKSFVSIAQTETKLMQEALKKKLADLKDLSEFVNGNNGKDN